MSKQILLFAIFLGICLSCSSEKEDRPKKSPEQIAVETLAGASGISYSISNGGSLKRNNFDETSLYNNFSLAFNPSGKTFNSSNGDDLFEKSGTWEFVGTNYDKIRLSGTKPSSGIEISYIKNNKELILRFNVPTPPSGRLAGIQALTGSYEIKILGN
jgi:hypothetical protein